MWMFKINTFMKVVRTNIPDKEFRVYIYCKGISDKPFIFYLSLKEIQKFIIISNI